MKTIYASPFVYLLLVGFTSQAQVNQAVLPGAADSPMTAASAGEAAVLRAASNAVHAATIVHLTNRVLHAAPGAVATAEGATARVPAAGSGVTVQVVSSNAAQAVTITRGQGRAEGQPRPVRSPNRTAGRSSGPMVLLDNPGGCVQPGSGLVSWWQAENDATDSRGLNPGVPAEGTLFNTGMVGQALNLDGYCQSVQIPYSSSLAPNCFSIEAWVCPATQLEGQSFIFGQSYGRQLVVWPGDAGAQVRFYIIDPDGFFDGLASTTEIPIGAWTHLAATWDATSLRIYINGELDAEGVPEVSTIGDTGLKFMIGGDDDYCGSWGQHFPGLIDEVSYYDRALLAAEINAINLAGSAGKCKTLPDVCATCPASAVSWWPGEGDAGDVFGNYPGTRINGASFAPGRVGQAFSLDGVNQSVEVPLPPNTLSSVFSVEAWVNPASQVGGWLGQAFIFGQSYGRQLVVRTGTWGVRVAWVISNNPWTFYVVESSGEIPINEWTHLVGTWDGASLDLYVNGALDQQLSLSTVAWDSGCGFSLGGANDPCGVPGQYFHGLIDEPTYYNQALSAAEVQALYNAGVAGKCQPQQAPTITSQPTSQTGYEWGTATFSVQATGPLPLGYQWTFNGANIGGATDSTYTKYDLQLADAGNYAVVVSGLDGQTVRGQVVSQDALLTVIQGASLVRPKRGFEQHLEADQDYYNFKFGGDMFIYVDGTVRLHGTTTFEGGAIVLFPADAAAKIIIEDGDIVCDTGPYRTVTFMSEDVLHFVNWLGDPVFPAKADYYGGGLSLAFNASSPVVLKYFQFFNLGCGISIDAAGTYKLYDCQFTDCNNAIAVTAAGADAQLYNNLFADDVNVFAPSGAALSAPHLTFQHITVDNCASGHHFVSAGLGNGTWAGTNSLLVNVAGVPSGLDSTCISPASGSGLFLPGGDASHYLVTDPSRPLGTPDIDSTLKKELEQKTTHPPLDLPTDLETAGAITLGPQAPRYAAGSRPDLGYYYDALDYTASFVLLLPGATFNVLPGTAIGLRDDLFAGFILEEGASFISHGTPTLPNTFAPVWTVQEGPFLCASLPPTLPLPNFLVTFLPDYWPEVVMDPQHYAVRNASGNPPPVLDFRFCNFYLPAGGPSHHFWSGQMIACLRNPYFRPTTSLTSAMSLQLRDCALHGGWINLGEPDSQGGVLPVWMEGPPVSGSVSLVNNLFDRVNINLDPDTGPSYWNSGPYPSPTIDLRLTATNNTFRGGWLALEPVKASAGNWVFENNLFDKTVFAQDTYQPLDFDYNAYWPCDPAELAAGQVAHLLPTPTTADRNGEYESGNELRLAGEPPYQSGPLGNFYLPDTYTPLNNKGSCSPAQVGLYHYTTRADQTKEGTSAKVSIGMHYVAVNPAGQPNPGLPKDYDTDGIPDYMENWHGDGATVWADETNWQADGSTLGHAYDPIYDDVDLSGNGLVGRVKKALNMQPLDTYNPLTLKQTTTSQEPDVVSFKVGHVVGGQFVPLTDDLVSSIGGLRLNLDGFDVAVQGRALATDDGTSALLNWNTTYEPPGPHLLQPRLTLNGIGVDTAILLGSGPLAPFYSDNVCRFFECDALFDQNGAYLDAQLPVPNATYSIQIFDPSTTPRRLLKTIPTKPTSSGMIQEDWLLDCDQGPSPFAGSAFDAVFDITLLGEDGSTPIAHGTPTKRHGKTDATVDGNGFDVAYMYTPKEGALGYSFSDPLGPVWVGMQSVVDTLTQPGWPWPDPGHYDSTFNWFTSPDHVLGKPGYITSMATVTAFLFPSMSDGLTKNFYCYAHGTANTLGTLSGDVQIKAGEVAALLGNKGLPGFPFAVPPSYPYRFVFLDGCDTASDNQWRQAFGIMPLGPPGQAARPKLGSQALLGWKGRKLAWFDGVEDPVTQDLLFDQSLAVQNAYAANLQAFFADWMNGNTLLTCIMHASDTNRVQCPLPVEEVKQMIIKDPFANPSFTVNCKPRPGQAPAKICVYGHAGLTRKGLIDISDLPKYDAPGNRR